MLGPHMKKADRDRAYEGLYNMIGDRKPKKKANKMSPEEVKAFLEQHKKQ